MKKALIILIVLLLIFSGIWIFKSKTPAQRPDSYATGYDDSQWWTVSLDTDVDDEWVLDPEIPDNYIPVPGEEELYMVVDENGNITKYRHRTQQEDGSWIWEDVNPDIPDNYEPVEGLENVYRVTDENGNVHYYRYIRNDDDTFAFVEVDENGNDLEPLPNGDEIPNNYQHLSGNVYAETNDYGVVIGYRERAQNDDGSYTWKVVQKPALAADDGSLSYNSQPPTTSRTTSTPETTSGTTSTPQTSIGSQTGEGTTTEVHSDGSYTETETILSTSTSGGWITTYQTIVTRTYDAQGNLLSTRKEGPTEISRTQVTSNQTQTPDKSQIASTLQSEVARVSVGMNYRTDLAQSVLANLNAERAANGVPTLRMASNTTAYQLAQARAAAMAAYDYSDYNSPLYGDLDTMLATFGISSPAPSENTWRANSSTTADAIHARFMSLSGSTCLSSDYTSVGIAIVEANGYLYIDEVFLSD